MPEAEIDWLRCVIAGCLGAVQPNTDVCLEHAAERGALDAFLASLGPGCALDVRGTTLTQELLDHVFNALRDSSGRVVFGPAWFDNAGFSGPISFDRVDFGKESSFRYAFFREDASFIANFKGPVLFDHSTFVSRASFNGGFRSTADFKHARFMSHAGFRGAVFQGDVSFYGASLDQEGQFQGAFFDKGVDFATSQFHGAALFTGGKFYGEGTSLNFAQVTFYSAALFDESKSSSVMLFENARFLQDVSFNDARFKQVQFTKSRFSHYISIARATAQEGMIFNSAEFDGTVILGPMGATLIEFDHAIFKSEVELEITADCIVFNHASFQGGGIIRLGAGQVQLEEAVFLRPTTVAASNTPLSLRHIDYGLVVLDRKQQHETSSVLTLRGTDTVNLTLSGVDLSRCLLANATNLDQLRLDGSVKFASRPWEGILKWFRSQRQMLVEEHHWRAQRFKHTRWSQVTTHPMHRGHPVVVQRPEVLAALYRSLRKCQEDIKNEPGAADFYYGEMEMRRHGRTINFAEWSIIVAYWLSSGYGLRAWRAVGGLLVSVTLAALLLQKYGFRHNFHPSYVDSLLYSVQSILLLSLPSGAISNAVLSTWGVVFRIILRVLGPALIALAILSVRNRIKR